MHRRRFIAVTPSLTMSGTLALVACTPTLSSPHTLPDVNSGRRRTIGADVDATMSRLYETVSDARQLLSKASEVSMLIFPSVISASFWVGGKYEGGALRIGVKTNGYYKPCRRIIPAAVRRAVESGHSSFHNARHTRRIHPQPRLGHRSRRNRRVAKDIDTSTAISPVEAIVMTNVGLMLSVSRESMNISRRMI
jgi:hypothetical protein